MQFDAFQWGPHLEEPHVSLTVGCPASRPSVSGNGGHKNRANVVDALVVPSALFMTCHRRKPCAEMIPAGERVRCNQQSVVRVRVQRGK